MGLLDPRPRRERGIGYRLLDNLFGIEDGVDTPGERLGKGVNALATGLLSDPLGTVGGAAQGVKADLDNLMFEGGAMQRPEAVLGYAAAPMAPGAARALMSTDYLASRNSKLYNFPTKSEVGDGLGIGLGKAHPGGLDLEGRPLVARYVVGSARHRTVEKSLPPSVATEIGKRFTRDGFAKVPRITGGGRGAVAGVGYDKYSRRPLWMQIKDTVSEADVPNVALHESGHVLDQMAGEIPTSGLMNELRPLYSYGVEGRNRTSNFTAPKHSGYSGDDAPREYMAESIRQYMVAPDTMKELAPKTAARIRKYINEHPELKDFIQFNGIAGAATMIGMTQAELQEAMGEQKGLLQ